MKVIFLDMDGVMVPFWGAGQDSAMKKDNIWEAEPMSKKAVKILNSILDETDAEIVISSDWRHYYSLPVMREIFKANGVKKLPIAYTNESKHYIAGNLEGGREVEISLWVKHHRIDYWVAIDDLNMTGLAPHFVFCQKPNGEGLKQTGLKDKVLKALSVKNEHYQGYRINMDSKEG